MKKLFIGLLFLGSTSAFAAPIPASMLPDYKEAATIAIEVGKRTCSHQGDFFMSKGFGKGFFYSIDLIGKSQTATIDKSSTDPLLTFTLVTNTQKLVLNINTSSDLKTITSYSVIEYVITPVAVNNGTLADPVIVHGTVDVATGTSFTCK